MEKTEYKKVKVLNYKDQRLQPPPLRTSLDVSIFLEKIIQWSVKGEMDMDTATKLTYMSGMLLKSIQQHRAEKKEDGWNMMEVDLLG
jgi:hypothetical protein